jgi:polyhydroxyalkanoate synthesis repressor PhaR
MPQRGMVWVDTLAAVRYKAREDAAPRQEGTETMPRLIKRYESRKLYDTEESRYVSLEELAEWIRSGAEVQVLDNATGADVTAQTLTQVILDEGRRGTAFLPTELLHELVRAGQRAVESGVEQVQSKVDRFVQASIDRLGPVRRAREEMERLRGRLEELEGSLSRLEEGRPPQPAPRRGTARPGTQTKDARRSRRKKGEPQ